MPKVSVLMPGSWLHLTFSSFSSWVSCLAFCFHVVITSIMCPLLLVNWGTLSETCEIKGSSKWRHLEYFSSHCPVVLHNGITCQYSLGGLDPSCSHLIRREARGKVSMCTVKPLCNEVWGNETHTDPYKPPRIKSSHQQSPGWLPILLVAWCLK